MSPGVIVIWRWSPRAMRPRASAARPASPSTRGRRPSRGMARASSRSTSRPSGTWSRPRSVAMPMLRTIERPVKHTLRSCFAAASSTCWTRCTWLAKQATIRRDGASRNTPSITGRDVALRGDEAGHLGVGGVDEQQVDALVAEAREAGQVGEPPVERQLVELDVAGVQHGAARGADGDGEGVGDRVVDREELAVERAVVPRSPSRTSSRRGVSWCSLHFAATSASVKRDPTTSRSGRWRRRNGTAPMWSSCPWVSTSASTSESRSSTARKSGRIRSTPGASSDGKSTPQSTMSSRPPYSRTVMFRPISPMPPRATTRSAPSGVGGGAPSAPGADDVGTPEPRAQSWVGGVEPRPCGGPPRGGSGRRAVDRLIGRLRGRGAANGW